MNQTVHRFSAERFSRALFGEEQFNANGFSDRRFGVIARTLLTGLVILALTACGGGGGAGSEQPVPPTSITANAINVGGSVGDGPVVDAHIVATDRSGAVIAQTTSDTRARFQLAIPADSKFPITVTASDGTDIVSNRAPDFDLKSVLDNATQANANITPITTMIVRAANCRSGGLTTANLKAAQTAIAQQLSAGLDAAKMPNPISTVVTDSNVAENVKANQVLAEIITRTTATLQHKGRTISHAEVIEALACDVADGVLDGVAASGGIAEVSSVAQAAIASVLTEAIVNQLTVSGKDAHDALDAAIHRVAPEASAAVNIDAVDVTPQVVAEARAALTAALPLQPDPAVVTLAQALENFTAPDKPATVAANLPSDAVFNAGTLLSAAQTASTATIASVGSNLAGGGGRATVVPTLTLTTSANEVAAGKTVTISWTSSDARTCIGIKGLDATLPTSGSRQSAPITQTTTFTMTCLNTTSSVTKSVVVNLPTATVTLSADKTSVNRNDRVTLRWSTNRVTTCSASGAWVGARGLSGSELVGPITAESRFVLTCTDAATAAVSQTVTVRIAPPTLTLTADQATVTLGAAPTLAWSSTNVDVCTATGDWTGARAASGRSPLPGITANKTYTLACAGPGGAITKTVAVGIAPPTLTLTTATQTANVGGNATLSWHATNSTSCTASGGWNGIRPVDGSNVSAPINAAAGNTFTLTCAGPGGTVAKSAEVRISPPTATLSIDRTAINAGESATLTWTSTNAAACTAIGAWTGTKATAASQSFGPISASSTFSLECAGPGGNSSRSSVTVSVRPSVTLTASSALVAPNTNVTLRWTALGGGSCIASSADARFNGPVAASGSVVTTPLPADRTFKLTCTNPAGTAIATTTVITHGTTVQWIAPTTMSDGTAIRALRGFNVYYGSQSHGYDHVVEVLDPKATRQVIPLSVGTWYLTVTAVAEVLDAANQVVLRESDYGTEAQHTTK